MAFGLPHVSYLGYPAPVLCPGHAGLGFREAGPQDAAAIAGHLARLSPEDRRLRFCATVSDAALAVHAETLLDRAGLVIAAFDGPLWRGPFHRPGPVRALAELAVDGREAEIGLSVDGGLRRRGVATCLVRAAAHLLVPRGARRIHAFTLPANAAMIGLGRRSGATIEVAGSDVEIVFDARTLAAAYLRRRLALPPGLASARRAA